MTHILTPKTGIVVAVKRFPGGAIKAISADGMRVGGYGHRYTSAEKPDLTKQYFRADTDFGEELGYKIEGLPIRIEHGMDKVAGLIGYGMLDFKREDEAGKWIEGKLKERTEYEDMLRQLRQNKGLNLTDDDIFTRSDLCERAVKAFFASGKVQWSSGADEQSVVVQPDGFIARWYPKEYSGTVQPAEPDGTEISPLKSLETVWTFGEGILPDGMHAPIVVISPDKNLPVQTSKLTGGNNMPLSREQLMQVLAPAFESMVEGLMSAMGGSPETDEMAAEATQSALATRAEEILNTEDKPEDAKSVEAWLEKHAATIADAGAKALGKLHQDRSKKFAGFGAKAMADARHAEGKSKLQTDPNAANGNGRIEVTNLKYAHASAADMALALDMMLTPARNMGMKHVDPLNYVSEDFLRNMAGKAHDTAWRDNQGLNPEQKLAFKSVTPYKANELDASNITGQGLEWVGQFWSTSIWYQARFEPTVYDTLVSKGMMVEEVPQGSQSVYFPTEGADPTVYTAPEANSVDASGRPETTINISPFGTGRVQATPKELKMATSVTVILDEDSVINTAKQVNYQINKKMPETRDQVVINGDTATAASTNINLIDGIPGIGLNTPYYINSNGLRKLPLVTTTSLSRDAGTTLDITDYLATLKLLSAVLRQNRNETLFIIDPDTETASLAIPAIATDDVRRTNATITDGVLQRIYGRDVVVSGFLPLANSAGKVPAAGGTLGSILCVYAPYWAVAWKRQITIETARDIYSGTNVWVASMRMCIVPRGTTGSSISYNVAI